MCNFYTYKFHHIYSIVSCPRIHLMRKGDRKEAAAKKVGSIETTIAAHSLRCLSSTPLIINYFSSTLPEDHSIAVRPLAAVISSRYSQWLCLTRYVVHSCSSSSSNSSFVACLHFFSCSYCSELSPAG